MNRLSRLGDTMALKPEVTSETLLSALQFWVDEASAVRKEAAFVRGYLAVQREYLERKEQQGGELSDPQFSPVARAANGRLYATNRELVLFTWRAYLDTDRDAFGIGKVKEGLCDLVRSSCSEVDRELGEPFSRFRCANEQRLLRIKGLRHKVIAHSDQKAVLGSFFNETEICEIVETAEAVCELIQHTCGVYIKNFEPPFDKRTALIVHPDKFAMHDAMAFWEHNFAAWAK